MTSIYFIAATDRAAIGCAKGSQLPDSDRTDAYQMITVPHLSALADLAESKPPAIDLSMVCQIWPQLPSDPAADLAWMSEPIVERIDNSLRDRIAAVDLETLPTWIDTWVSEVGLAVPPTQCPRLAGELVRLAAVAQQRDASLYNYFEL